MNELRLEVRRARESDLAAIKALLDLTLARDFYSMEALRGMLANERDLLYVVVDADKGDEVVSYFYAFIAGLDEALRILHVKEKPEVLSKYDKNTLVAVYKASSTKKEYRKNGICSSFVRDLQPVVRDLGAELILATAVHPYGREEPMRHIFNDTGFTTVTRMYRPWAGIRAYCPYCKQEYCICDAVFYIKKTHDTGGDSPL